MHSSEPIPGCQVCTQRTMQERCVTSICLFRSGKRQIVSLHPSQDTPPDKKKTPLQSSRHRICRFDVNHDIHEDTKNKILVTGHQRHSLFFSLQNTETRPGRFGVSHALRRARPWLSPWLTTPPRSSATAPRRYGSCCFKYPETPPHLKFVRYAASPTPEALKIACDDSTSTSSIKHQQQRQVSLRDSPRLGFRT